MIRIDDTDLIQSYIAPLLARGQGAVASASVGSRSVAVDGDTVRLAIAHASLGSYVIVLEDVRPQSDDYDAERMGFSTLHYAHDSGHHAVTLARRTIFGPAGITYRAATMYVERHDAESPPGACAVCAGTRFQLRMSMTMEVEAANDHELMWDGNDAELRNVLVLLACSSCRTPHPGGGMGSLRKMSLNGHELNRASDTVSLSQLRSDRDTAV